eukprot:scaffold44058_cov72-Phaeocystis_antarctica.AAC.1
MLRGGQPRGEWPGPAQRTHRAGPPEVGPRRVQPRPLPAVVGVGMRIRVEGNSTYLLTSLPADRGRTSASAAARAGSASRLALNGSESDTLAEADACASILSLGCERWPFCQRAERRPEPTV